MISNCKDFNARTSESYKDADKVQEEMASYFSTRGINPQRDADRSYVVPPTPVSDMPKDDGGDRNESRSAEKLAKIEQFKARIVLRKASHQKPPFPLETDEETVDNQPVS